MSIKILPISATKSTFLDNYIVWVIIAFSLIILLISVVIKTHLYALTSFFILMSSVFWILLVKKRITPLFYIPRVISSRLLVSLFFIIVAIIILSYYYRLELYSRPIVFFLLAAFLAGLVTFQILSIDGKKNYYVILFEVIIIGLILEVSQIALFPDVIGIDPAYNKRLSLGIISSGYIPEDDQYGRLPIFHLLQASAGLIVSIDYKISTMFTISLTQILISTLVIYLIGYNLFNEKVGLLGALLLIFSDMHVLLGSEGVPNVLGYVFILLVIYLIIFRSEKASITHSAMILFIIAISIMTHIMAPVGLLVLLLVGFFSSRVLCDFPKKQTSSNTSRTSGIIILVCVMTFAWWSYVSGTVDPIKTVISSFNLDFLYSSGQGYRDVLNEIPIEELILVNLGRLAYFAAALLGVLFSISIRDDHDKLFLFAIMGIAPLAIGYLMALFGLGIVQGRWWYLAEIMLAIQVAVALLLINGLGESFQKLKRLWPSIMPLAVTLISLLLLLSPLAKVDENALAPNTSTRIAWTSSEINAASFFSEVTIGNISSDYHYGRNPSSSVFINYYGLDKNNMKIIDKCLWEKHFRQNGDVIVLRSYIIDNPFGTTRGTYRLDYNPEIEIMNSGFNKIFASSSVTAYR